MTFLQSIRYCIWLACILSPVTTISKQFPSINISAAAEDSQLTITHRYPTTKPTVLTVGMEKRIGDLGNIAETETFSNTFDGYVDNPDVGFKDITTAPKTSTSTGPIRDKIDMEADHGMVPYYLPLDGRQYEGFDFPLSNIEPLGDGTSRVTAVTNDGGGTTLTGVFDANVVGKTFVAIDAHLNGKLGNFIDEHVPNAVSPRYATVTNYDDVNGSWIEVDFEYNGGNIDKPQNSTNVLAYIGYDNSAEWANVVADWRDLSSPTKIIGRPLSRKGYVLSAYYIRELTQVELNIAKDFYIGTSDRSPMRIKHGVEERYGGVLHHFGDGNLRWKDPEDIFVATNYANQAISHNVQWISPHKPYKPSKKHMATGSLTTGLFMCVGNYTKREWDELSNGYGFDTDKLLWQMGSSEGLAGNGTYTGSGETYDVENFGFNAHINCDYDGPNALGATGGSIRGANYNVYDNVTFNFNPQAKWVPFTQRLSLRFTIDKTEINDTDDELDPSTYSYLPSHAVETNDGNFYATRYMGGNSRATILHIDQWIFPFNHPRYNQIDSYYNLCYNNNGSTLPRSSTPAWREPNAGKYTCSNSKALVHYEIPEAGGVITIQRQHFLKYPIAGNSDPTVGERTANPTIKGFSTNGVHSMINWGLAFQKRAEDFTADELTYISTNNKRPFAAQPGDTFKLLAWVDVDDDTGFAKGQAVTVTGPGGAITTGKVHEVDNTLHTRRIKIKGATADVSAATSITNGTQTANVIVASSFDPTIVYTFARVQGGMYAFDWNGVKGGGDGYGQGFAESKARRVDGYTPWSWMVTPSLPSVINGEEGSNDENTTNLLFEVEIVNSQAEYLLDGQYRAGILTYKGIQRIGGINYWFQIDETTRQLSCKESNSGHGLPVPELGNNASTDTTFDGLLDPFGWPQSGDPQGHMSYNRAELTWYMRMPSGWQDTPYRQSLANMGNNGSPRYGGDTAYKTKDLSRYSKGITLIGEISGMGRLLMAESGSSRAQFESQGIIYDNNPSYVPQYAIDEGMLPPNETGIYVPKLRVYGQTAIDYAQSTTNNYGYEAVYDTNISNAPDLPKTVRDALTAIGEL